MKRALKNILPHWGLAFLNAESAGGVVMILAAIAAIVLANSPWSLDYHAAIAYPLPLSMTVGHFVSDVLMVLFFFTVGMELKHEMREGALAAPGQKILPLLAALGGIIAPALIYCALTRARPELGHGWAIPTATDIAFALCVLRLIGGAVPRSATMFLLAIAIYDDLAAIIIIALFYSTGIALPPLAAAAGICVLLWLLNRMGVSRITPYLLLGTALWFAIHHAGIHPTVAGVITGIAIPLRTRAGAPVLHTLLTRIHPYVAFGVLPLFALTSAGLDLRGITVAEAFAILPVSIALALFCGKPVGILTATWLGIRLKLATLPTGMGWGLVYAMGVIAGIGFTMSLFLSQLAFAGAELQNATTLGVIGGSLLAAFWGTIVLKARRTP